jgi:glycosyltransferase involved in cell wall biosynthesis
MKKISLCVPSYNRPETLRQLINSYRKQNYPNKELVISDDSPNESIKKMVEKLNDKTIRYFHNYPGLGFSKNLLESIKRASGDYIILLGDDDVFLSPDVFSEYVKVFEENSSVGFIYSNQIQFSNKMNVEYIINFFSENKLFKKGKEAMENMWIRSIFIGGIGIRNSRNIIDFYSKKKILHPQVELIGNIINSYDAYIISKNYIGFRSHSDQIIFRALKNKTVRQEGHHMTIELLDIFNSLKRKYNLEINFDFAAKQLISQQLMMTFKEKSILGNDEMKKNYKNFCKVSDVANNSRILKCAYLLARVMPPFGIDLARSLALKMLEFKNKKEFDRFKAQLTAIISE